MEMKLVLRPNYGSRVDNISVVSDGNLEEIDNVQKIRFPIGDKVTDDEIETMHEIEREKINIDKYFSEIKDREYIVSDDYLPEWSSEDEFIKDLEEKKNPMKYLKFIEEEKRIFEEKYLSKFDSEEVFYEGYGYEDEDYDEDYFGDHDDEYETSIKNLRTVQEKKK